MERRKVTATVLGRNLTANDRPQGKSEKKKRKIPDYQLVNVTSSADPTRTGENYIYGIQHEIK